MKKARILVSGITAGVLEKLSDIAYRFTYDAAYHGPAVSLAMPVKQMVYEFDRFPPFVEGLLPEGVMLEALLRIHKLDKNDYFEQLLKIGQDVVGAITIEECE